MNTLSLHSNAIELSAVVLRRFCIILVLGSLTAWVSFAQIPRERANPNGPVEDVFWAPTIINTSSVTNLEAQNLNFTIMHVFGLATNGVEDLFGLDGSANIRFGLDYGVTDRFSVGVGRSRFDKLYDGRFKLNLLRQSKRRGSPIEFAVKGTAGITTVENGFELADRLSYHASAMIARKFNDRLSIQVAPMFSHFNTVFKSLDVDGNILEEENDHMAIAVAGRIVLTDILALTAEYVPVIGERSDGTLNAFAIGVDINTGGHVFQLFYTTSQWLTEQHHMARNKDGFAKGGRRLGFNVNRVFAL